MCQVFAGITSGGMQAVGPELRFQDREAGTTQVVIVVVRTADGYSEGRVPTQCEV